MPGKDLIRLTEAEAERLADLYAAAEREILDQINKALLRGNRTEYLKAMLENVNIILEDLRAGSRTWCEQAIPRIYVASTKFTDEQLEAAGVRRMAAGFGAIHQQAAQVLAEAAYKRFDETALTIGRRADDIYRTLALENVRGSVIGYKTWEQVARNFREQLAAEGVTGFKDKAGRQWNMRTYSKMVARTTTMECHLEGTKNRLLEHGYDLVIISSHYNPCDKCAPWEGQVVSLTGRTEGYPTLDEAKTAGLFHPNCRHTYGLYLDLEAEVRGLESDGGPEADIPVAGISEAAKQGIARAMSDALAHGLKTNTECLLTLDANTGKMVYNKLTGTADQVVLTQDLINLLGNAPERSIIEVHNHPSSSSFSDADLGLMAQHKSIAGLFVVGHDGTRYYAGKKNVVNFDPIQIRAEYQKYRTKYYGYYFNLVASGKMTPEDAWREHSHKIMVDMAKSLGFEYVRWNEP